MPSKKQLDQIKHFEAMEELKKEFPLDSEDIMDEDLSNDVKPTKQGQLNVENLFSEMLNVDSENAQQKIVNEIVNDNNLELKTEIGHVSETTILQIHQEFLEQNQLHKSANTLSRYLNTLFRFSVSKNRKSREELIRMVEALSSSIQTEQTNQKINLIN
jgi:hypothetical protein